MKTRSKTPAVTRSTSPRGSRSRRLKLLSFPLRMVDGSLLTPARIRGLHALLDELIQIRATGVPAIVGTIELTWRVQREANDGEAPV